MAGLLNENINHFGGNCSTDLNRIMHNPMFVDLQATLMSDMNVESVPYALQNFDQSASTLSLYPNNNVSFNDASYASSDDSSHKEYTNEHSVAVSSNEAQHSSESGYIELNNNDYSKYDYNQVHTTSDIGETTVSPKQDQSRSASPTEMEESGHLNELTSHDSDLQHSIPSENTPTQMIEMPTSSDVHQLHQTPIDSSPTKEDSLQETAIPPAMQPLDEIVTIAPQMESSEPSTYAHEAVSVVSSSDAYNAAPTIEESGTYEYSSLPTTSSESYNSGQSIEGSKPYMIHGSYPVVNNTPTSFPTAETPTKGLKEEGFDLLVEEATLQAEFRQMGPLGNDKVSELENFYNTKNAEIMTHHSDAITRLHARELDPELLDLEVNQLNYYYNKQREHLVVRISQSLQLFKNSLPTEPPPPVPSGGAKKPSKSRLLNSKAVSIMNTWYQEHIDYPYPSDEQKQQLAEDGGISLAQAASFGKCFLTDYQPETFVHMCQMLRVLNAVRDYNLGIPLTYSQLQHLSLTVLIDRLVLRRHYCLAIEICKYLKLPEAEGASRILAHWACYKVQQTAIDDETVARAIASKLGDTPGVSYSEIANKAIECGRTQLAVRLLDYEPRAVEQVPLLMKMKKNKEALTKAIESGDTDLVFTVIIQLKESLGLGEFLMVIRSYPTAYSLYLQYCREQNRKLLQDIFEQEDQFVEEANCRVWESYQEERLEARLSCLSAAQDAYGKGRNDWAAKQTEEQIRLLKTQRKLESDYNRPYMDMTLHETMYRLIQESNHKWADQLKKDFKVPDRRFWWLKIEALAEAGDWSELDRFSKSKKSPIGYEPFVEVCMKYQHLQEAEKYIQRVTVEHKVKCLVKMGKFNEAAETAFQQKDADGLSLVIQKAGSNKEVVDHATRLRAQLGGR